MGETYSINYLRNRLTSITALAIFWISLSLAYTQILSSSPVAFADEINLSDELSSQETNPCNLGLSGTSRSSTSASLTPLGDTNAINGEQPGGLREYLSQIQTQISRFWSLLPRNLPEAVLTTVVNFRLDRAGMITNVNIQQSSGNEYSDLAARQALKSAVPLPQFPRYIADRYLDVVYTFSVENANTCISGPSTNVVINAVPANPILGGANEVCLSSFANVTPNSGGTWMSSNIAIATVTNTGVVSGVSVGTVTLTFTQSSTGCSSSKSFTVNANPVLGGANEVCVGSSATVSPTTGVTGSLGLWPLRATSRTMAAVPDPPRRLPRRAT